MEERVNADEQLVIDRCDEVVAEHDPKQHRPADVLGAQYDAGIAWVHFPEGFGGLGLSPRLQNVVNARLTAAGAPLPYGRNPIGHGMCAPTIVTHGSDEQKRQYLRPLFTGEEIWCQMFSEPGAGSDVASLSTRAVRDGDEWLLNGQKVWTTLAHVARYGIIIARTDPEQLKHKGLTMFVVDMQAPGVEVRPLVQATGEAEFNEVFFEDVFVPDEHVVGTVDDGWRVSSSTLTHERGTNPRQLVIHVQLLEELLRLAVESGVYDDHRLQQRLTEAYVEVRLFQLHNWRSLSRLANGRALGPEGSALKLYWSEMSKRLHETAMAVLGPAAPLWHGADGNPGDGRWQRSWLYYQSSSIFAGTNEIQRNIIGERVLGLPR
jgi:alkylation response protein AidB-like acyl-CoA dehydrogenase